MSIYVYWLFNAASMSMMSTRQKCYHLNAWYERYITWFTAASIIFYFLCQTIRFSALYRVHAHSSARLTTVDYICRAFGAACSRPVALALYLRYLFRCAITGFHHQWQSNRINLYLIEMLEFILDACQQLTSQRIDVRLALISRHIVHQRLWRLSLNVCQWSISYTSVTWHNITRHMPGIKIASRMRQLYCRYNNE